MNTPAVPTRQRILKAILKADEPLKVDDLTKFLGISRNATYQHVMALERDRLIEKAAVKQTKGRPCQTYQLTENGRATFPRHYILLANLLVGLVKSRIGAEQLRSCMEELGHSLAKEFQSRVAGLSGHDLVVEVAKIMQELGYEADALELEPGESNDQLPVIRAHNCVFHDLAKEHEDVCALDLALISQLTGKQVEHQECAVRGGTCCRFRIS